MPTSPKATTLPHTTGRSPGGVFRAPGPETDSRGICWWLIRAIGFNLFLLTLGWLVVEIVLTRRIPFPGLFTESPSEPTALYSIAHRWLITEDL